ncbi:MAG: Gfo/Idh/MocA family oxidoreductase [Pseudomonadota bacterium]|nr:Gfo/Idh/MocA family oxidoreductase [Pseudomonadota bacterium]
MSPRPMRVALYGHGHMGRLHARHLAGHDVVVVDPALGLHGAVGDLDAAIIATPTSTHAAVALPLLERGVPCLVEKPLAATLEDARALGAFPHLMVGHIERFNPAYGVLAGVDARFVLAERVGRFTPRGTDVDVILDLMIHDLDLFLHLTGEDIAEVRANGVAVATGGYDLAQARVETPSGRVGTFTASRLARQPARKLRVFAEGEYWSVDLRERQAARVRFLDGELREERVDVPEQDALGAEIAAFLAAARGDARYPVTGTDGVRALELAWRIRDAIRG